MGKDKGSSQQKRQAAAQLFVTFFLGEINIRWDGIAALSRFRGRLATSFHMR